MGNGRLVIRVHEGSGIIEFDIDGGGFDLGKAMKLDSWTKGV